MGGKPCGKPGQACGPKRPRGLFLSDAPPHKLRITFTFLNGYKRKEGKGGRRKNVEERREGGETL